MSNKIIGIKQADGSFYPLLQEGKPDNKKIELTTVRDDQTTVKVHLYKKEADSAEEPEYVDTLLIENLIPHPKQEPTIKLNIKLDENDMLTAEVLDPETGKKSDTQVSLVTLSEAQLLSDSDFTVMDAQDIPDTDGGSLENTGTDLTGDSNGTEAVDMPALNDDDFKLDDLDLNDLGTPDTAFEDTTLEQNSETLAESAENDFELPDISTDDMDLPEDVEQTNRFDSADETVDKTETEEMGGADLSDMHENTDTTEADTEQDSDHGDFKLDDFDSLDTENLNMDMPDFDAEDDETESTPAAQTLASDISMQDKNTEPADTGFKTDTFGKTNTFDMSTPDFNTANENTSFMQEEVPPLYDQDLPDKIDYSGKKKKCRIPMVICIICAILCILAVIGIFFFFPWTEKNQMTEENVVSVEKPAMTPPGIKEEDMTEAEPDENLIVPVEKTVVEEKQVVPEKTVPAAETKQEPVRYLITWGDTLWDLSDTYYRNPWLYPVIARENKIKNPDLIIAGTYIIIPPR